MITISQLAIEQGIHPRAARSILRASGRTKPEGGWSFDDKQADEVRVLLKTKPTRKASTPHNKVKKPKIPSGAIWASRGKVKRQKSKHVVEYANILDKKRAQTRQIKKWMKK